MRTCSNCGTEIGLDDVFCTNCGTGQAPPENRASPGFGSRPAVDDGYAGQAIAAAGITQRVAALNGPREPGQAVGTATALKERPQLPTPVNAVNASPRVGETLDQRYLRQTRNASVFIAVIVGIFTAITLIGVIWTAATISKLDSQLNGVSNVFGNTNCQSQGGTNPSC